MLIQKILLCLAISCMAGCVSNRYQELASDNSFDERGNLIDNTQSSDGPPHAISQYLDQLREAGKSQQKVAQVTPKKATEQQAQ